MEVMRLKSLQIAGFPTSQHSGSPVYLPPIFLVSVAPSLFATASADLRVMPGTALNSSIVAERILLMLLKCLSSICFLFFPIPGIVSRAERMDVFPLRFR